jgi:hypothetical protein
MHGSAPFAHAPSDSAHDVDGCRRRRCSHRSQRDLPSSQSKPICGVSHRAGECGRYPAHERTDRAEECGRYPAHERIDRSLGRSQTTLRHVSKCESTPPPALQPETFVGVVVCRFLPYLGGRRSELCLKQRWARQIKDCRHRDAAAQERRCRWRDHGRPFHLYNAACRRAHCQHAGSWEQRAALGSDGQNVSHLVPRHTQSHWAGHCVASPCSASGSQFLHPKNGAVAESSILHLSFPHGLHAMVL